MTKMQMLTTVFGIEKEGTIKIAPHLHDRKDPAHAARQQFAAALGELLGHRTVYQRDRTKWHPQQYTVVADCTVMVDNPFKPKCTSAEVKTPVFPSASVEFIPVLLNKFAECGLRPNMQSGLHMHMGRELPGKNSKKAPCSLWEPQEVVAFMDSFAANRDAIYSLVAPHRYHGEYCRPNPEVDPAATAWVIKHYETGKASRHDALAFLTRLYCPSDHAPEAGAENSAHYGNRHFAVNLTSIFKKGTIEIKLREAANAASATPFFGVMLHMLQAGINQRPFCWDEYAAAVNDNPALALPATPSRPIARLQPVPAVAVRQG